MEKIPNQEENQPLPAGQETRDNKREREIRPIDIFDTPLMFRTIGSVAALLELGSREMNEPTLAIFNNLMGRRPDQKGRDLKYGKYTYFETTLPVRTSNYEGNPHNTLIIDDVASSCAKHLEEQEGVRVSPSAIKELFTKAAELGHKPYEYRKEIEEGKDPRPDLLRATQSFIETILSNPEIRLAYLALQKSYMRGEVSATSHIRGLSLLRGSLFGQFSLNSSGGCFAVDLQSVKNRLVANPEQSHGDFGFELLLMGRLQKSDIAAYLMPVNPRRIGETLVDKLRRHRMDTSFMSKKEEFIYWASGKYRENPQMEGIRLSSKEIQTMEDFIRRSATATIGEAGKVGLHGMHPSDIHHYAGVKDVYALTIDEYDRLSAERFLKRAQVLFPDHVFSNPSSLTAITSEIVDLLIEYIHKEYGLDPNVATTTDLEIAVCKKVGIPIFDTKGNMVWPEKKTHAEVVAEIESRKRKD